MSEKSTLRVLPAMSVYVFCHSEVSAPLPSSFSAERLETDFLSFHDQQPDVAVACQFGDRFEVLYNRGKPTVASPAVELSWPLPADGFLLESAEGLPSTWSPVNTAPIDLPGQRRAVGIERTGEAKFFRLRKQ